MNLGKPVLAPHTCPITFIPILSHAQKLDSMQTSDSVTGPGTRVVLSAPRPRVLCRQKSSLTDELFSANTVEAKKAPHPRSTA